MPRITEVVKNLIIINVLVFAGAWFILDGNVGALAMHWPTSPYFKPFQIVSHMFMHGSIMHLLFNMVALFMFGPPLEYYWGPKRFLFFYLFSGFGALAFHLLMIYLQVSVQVPAEYQSMTLSASASVLGASGAICGLLLGFGMMFPNAELMLIFLPIPIKAKYFVTIFIAVSLLMGFIDRWTHIAHFAHVGGALAGLALIQFWRFSRRENMP